MTTMIAPCPHQSQVLAISPHIFSPFVEGVLHDQAWCDRVGFGHLPAGFWDDLKHNCPRI